MDNASRRAATGSNRHWPVATFIAMKKSGDVRKRREPPDRGGWGPDAGPGQSIAPEEEPQGDAKNVQPRDEREPSPPSDEEAPEDES